MSILRVIGVLVPALLASLPASDALVVNADGTVAVVSTMDAGNVTVGRSSQAAATEVVRGDDPRLSDARVASGGNAATVGGLSPASFVQTADVGQPDGVASLDSDGKLDSTQLPSDEAVGIAATSWAARLTTAEFYEEFLTPMGQLQGTFSGTGAGATSQNVVGGGKVGLSRIVTGTTSGGKVALHTGFNQIILPDMSMKLMMRGRFRLAPTSAENFVVRIGLQDAAAADSTNGLYFRVTDGVNQGKWQCVARKAGAETVVNTTSTAGLSLELPIIDYSIVRMDGEPANFYLDGQLVGTIDASVIPLGPAARMGIALSLVKTTGSNPRDMDVDAVHLQCIFDGSR